jgi:uncharacterized membrane protein
MAAYKDKVREDLDRWIADGLVAADKRGAILATLPDARRLDAATALAWVGGLLLGIAFIAFVAANWDGLPRLARFILILAAFAVAAGAGAWASHVKRPVLTNISLMLSALIFAAAIGFTGQIFDIAGDPKSASYAAGLAGFALALAGRSTGAATVGLAFIAIGDFTGREFFSGVDNGAPWMLAAAPLGAFFALRWGSAPLAHASALAIIYCFFWFAVRSQADAPTMMFLSVGLAAMAAAARWLHTQERAFASVFYGWFAWAALMFFAIGGYVPWINGETQNGGMLHRVVWLAASGGVIALGRFDRHTMVTAVGVLSIIGAICALLLDLGLDLLAAAGVFLLCAVAALIAGLALRRRKANA